MHQETANHVQLVAPPQPKRVLGFRDLVMFYVVATLSLRWIAVAASAGPSSIVIWFVGLVAIYESAQGNFHPESPKAKLGRPLGPPPSMVMLDAKHFPEELLHTMARRTQRFPTQRSHAVHAPPGFPIALQMRAQRTLVLEAVQDGIKRSCTYLVSMARQFLGDPNAVNRLFGRVVEDVQTNKPRVKTLVIHFDFQCPVSISKQNIKQRRQFVNWGYRLALAESYNGGKYEWSRAVHLTFVSNSAHSSQPGGRGSVHTGPWTAGSGMTSPVVALNHFAS